MVAFSINSRKWYRGALLYLGVRKTIILGFDDNGSFCTTVNIYQPMSNYQHKHIVVKYINLVDETMQSTVDGWCIIGGSIPQDQKQAQCRALAVSSPFAPRST